MVFTTTAVELVRRFRHIRALVIGDAMLDTYLEGSAARLCSEGPVPVVRKTSERRAPGGAANTAANLRALDADVVFLSIIGNDSAGTLLRSTLRVSGVDDSWLVEDEQASTLHKMRILADGQYVVRFDDEETHHYTQQAQERLLAHLEHEFLRCDLVIVSDYTYGVVSDALIERLRVLQAQQPKTLLIDSKDLYRLRDVGATVVTPNHLEAQLLVAYKQAAVTSSLSLNRQQYLEGIARVGEKVLSMIHTEHVAITLGSEGVFLLDHQGNTLHLPAHPIAQANDIGAGDSFASAMALALAAGATLEAAARIAIDAAAIAIGKRGTSVVHHQELLQRVSLRDHTLYSGGQFSATAMEADAMAADAINRSLMARLDEARNDGKRIVFTNGVFDILHAGHVQFLRQAKALGDVLVVGVNSDNSTRRLKGMHRPINSERDRMALVAALDPVDHVIIFDEDTPTELIRTLRPHIHVKGGDYADEELPEAGAVREVGGRIVILPLAGSVSTSSVIDRIVALAHDSNVSRVGVPHG
ncbi:MAG TPA: D-glycero-beta-D-manno-heptose 1-phosphate adenylyltransferase, partial [Ktedonobacteraceae bacterium]|nr:D-glycero-beta-D-manno-heptose 1-phosphate adenylyltransferase [Ktedonobacteraceae bacterium]